MTNSDTRTPDDLRTPDLHPAAARLSAVVSRIGDADLGRPTPCPDLPVAGLLDHVAGLGAAFAACARKDLGEQTSNPPMPDAANLDPHWRTSIPPTLDRLADAWSEPAAWEGFTQIGGVDLPGEIAGLIALDEILLHAWDLAAATGQPFTAGDDELLAIVPFLQDPSTDRSGALFGPIVEVPADAPLLDRVLGLSGRDPRWSASRSSAAH